MVVPALLSCRLLDVFSCVVISGEKIRFDSRFFCWLLRLSTTSVIKSVLSSPLSFIDRVNRISSFSY